MMRKEQFQVAGFTAGGKALVGCAALLESANCALCGLLCTVDVVADGLRQAESQ